MFLFKNLLSRILFIELVFFASLAFALNFKITRANHFSELASSFLRGELHFRDDYVDVDQLSFNSKKYWVLGPFPSVLLTPFVYAFSLLGLTFYQGYLNFFLIILVFYLCFRLALILKYSKEDSLFFAFAFIFSSVYQVAALTPFSWYFAQAISVLALLFAMFEFFTKRRYLIIGIAMSILLATRTIAFLSVVFFVLTILIGKAQGKVKCRQILYIFGPVLVSLVLLFLYNYARFGDPMFNGYLKYAESLGFGFDGGFAGGLFNIKNIPGNFYNYFVSGLGVYKYKYDITLGGFKLTPFFLKVSPPGTSFFVVSPVFLYVFRSKLKSAIEKRLFITIFIMLFALLSFYWSGWLQLGPRYTLDFLPLLFILFLYSFKERKLSGFAKILILGSSVFNFGLYLTVYICYICYLAPICLGG